MKYTKTAYPYITSSGCQLISPGKTSMELITNNFLVCGDYYNMYVLRYSVCDTQIRCLGEQEIVGKWLQIQKY